MLMQMASFCTNAVYPVVASDDAFTALLATQLPPTMVSTVPPLTLTVITDDVVEGLKEKLPPLTGVNPSGFDVYT